MSTYELITASRCIMPLLKLNNTVIRSNNINLTLSHSNIQ